uniref:uncharacterized protein LOC123998805 n=1 Tax=Oncorhynchus gorbuscha TaxID=8017 RepID=UPI001EAF5D07|nr:uncharacterized protein LOC123998805 [Oncorhynchus gorbuscha]
MQCPVSFHKQTHPPWERGGCSAQSLSTSKLTFPGREVDAVPSLFPQANSPSLGERWMQCPVSFHKQTHPPWERGGCSAQSLSTSKLTCPGIEVDAVPSLFPQANCPALGERWMQCPVSFHKQTHLPWERGGCSAKSLSTSKLTNTLNSNSLVVLHSMHKYQPCLHIVLSPDPHSPLSGDYLHFTFPEAAFIAVTAYQNSEVQRKGRTEL